MRLLPRRAIPSTTLIDEVRNGVLVEQHAELEKLHAGMAPNRVIEEEFLMLLGARCKPDLSQKLREAADLILVHGTQDVQFLPPPCFGTIGCIRPLEEKASH
jgi:hypothetical protein